MANGKGSHTIGHLWENNYKTFFIFSLFYLLFKIDSLQFSTILEAVVKFFKTQTHSS